MRRMSGGRCAVLGWLGLILSFTWTTSTMAGTFATLDHPSAVDGTFPLDVSGGSIVGFWRDAMARDSGFFYDGSTFTTLSDPLGITYPNGISGRYIVGSYQSAKDNSVHGFIYDGSTYTTLDVPGGRNVGASRISGNHIVGGYENSSSNNTHGFIYDMTDQTYSTLDFPSALVTNLGGISGSNIVGTYEDPSFHVHAFLFDGSIFTTLDAPLAAGDKEATGIDGNNIVGYYVDASNNSHGFLYNGSTWTTLDDPLATNTTQAYGIGGNVIVGSYDDSSGLHGFVYSIPEPTAMALLGAGVVGLLAYAWRQRWAAQNAR